MKPYTSCFIGIPLPSSLQTEFEELLKQVGRLDPKVEPVYSETPHVTLYYLNQEAQMNLIKISESVKPVSGILDNIQIEIGGLGYFNHNNKIVFYLNVKENKELTRLNQQFSLLLPEYASADNKLDFLPHVTVGKLDTSIFEDLKADLIRLLNKKWIITVTEIYLYGVDSTVSPEFQEKIIGIEI